MPDLLAAVAAFLSWPDVPDGWTRHRTPDGVYEYPEEEKSWDK